MRQITELTEQDLDRLMKEADLNGNGVIEYEEFVDWLMQPPTRSQARAMIDYSNVLRPLFNAYDRNRNGKISYEEFEECHGILRAALKKAAEASDGEASPLGQGDPMDLHIDSEAAFRKADPTQDGVVTFRDFVEWMQDHLTRGDVAVKEDELVDITTKLGRMMDGVFRLQQIAGANPLKKAQLAPSGEEVEETKVLHRLMENLAKTARELEEALSGDPDPADRSHPNVWTEPPIGMSVQRLKGTHMMCAPLKPSNIEDVTFEILCLPAPGGQKDPSSRRWYGEVVRRVKWKAGQHAVERPAYYVYYAESLRWKPLWDSAEFDRALDQLAPELALFCLLQTEADFGDYLLWSGIQQALRLAANMDLIKRNQIGELEAYMQEQVREMYAKQGLLCVASPTACPRSADDLVEDFLGKLRLRPRLVMAKLSELNIVSVSPVWKDFMHSGLSTPRDPSPSPGLLSPPPPPIPPGARRGPSIGGQ